MERDTDKDKLTDVQTGMETDRDIYADRMKKTHKTRNKATAMDT